MHRKLLIFLFIAVPLIIVSLTIGIIFWVRADYDANSVYSRQFPHTTTTLAAAKTSTLKVTQTFPIVTTTQSSKTTQLPKTTFIPTTHLPRLSTKDAYFVLDYRGNQGDDILKKQGTIVYTTVLNWKISSTSNRIGLTFNSEDEFSLDLSDNGQLQGTYTKDLTTLYLYAPTLINFACIIGNLNCGPSIYPFAKTSFDSGPTITTFLSGFKNSILSIPKFHVNAIVTEIPSQEFTFIMFTQPDSQLEIDNAVNFMINDLFFHTYKISFIIIKIRPDDGLDYSMLSRNNLVLNLYEPYLSNAITQQFGPIN